MIRIRSIALPAAFAATLFVPSAAHAQSILETLWSDVKSVPGDILYVWSAPLRIDGEDVPPLAAFVGGTVLVGANDAAIQDWIRDHRETAAIQAFEPFRHEHGLFSELGRNHKVLRYAGAGYVVGLVLDWDWLREGSLGCITANTSNSWARSLIYGAISRTRPSHADDPYEFDVPGGDWEYHSFPGGHGANAFACASFIANRFELGYAEPVAWGIATGVAVARTIDDAHWASDTVVGIGLGWITGRLVAHRFLEREARRERGRAETDVGFAADPGADAGFERVPLTVTPVATDRGTVLLLSTGVRF